MNDDDDYHNDDDDADIMEILSLWYVAVNFYEL